MENVTANKRAYELGGIAIGFLGIPNLGDAIINKKVIEALAILEPNCNIDIICEHERSKIYAKAFFSEHKNFNSILKILTLFLKFAALVILRGIIIRNVCLAAKSRFVCCRLHRKKFLT